MVREADGVASAVGATIGVLGAHEALVVDALGEEALQTMMMTNKKRRRRRRREEGGGGRV